MASNLYQDQNENTEFFPFIESAENIKHIKERLFRGLPEYLSQKGVDPSISLVISQFIVLSNKHWSSFVFKNLNAKKQTSSNLCERR